MLLDFVHLASAFRAIPLDKVFFRPEPFIGHAVPAFVAILVNFIPVKELLQNIADQSFMSFLSSADKIAVGNIEPGPKLLEPFMKFIDMLLRLDTQFFCRLKDFLSMLVCSREEGHLISFESFIASDHIGGNGGIGMSDVRYIVYIINRGC